MVADVGRAIAMATGGALAFAPIEYALTVASYAGAIHGSSALALAALTATLAIWLWLLLAAGLSAVLVAARLVRAQIDPGRACGPGWLAAPAPIAAREARPGVARLWAGVAVALATAAVIQRGAALAIEHFKEPQLTAALIAGLAVGWLVIAGPVHRAAWAITAIAAAGLGPVLGLANPLGRWRAAGVALAGLAGAGLAACWLAVPQSRSVLPVRLVAAGLVIGLGMGLGALRHARPARPARPTARRSAAPAARSCSTAASSRPARCWRTPGRARWSERWKRLSG